MYAGPVLLLNLLTRFRITYFMYMGRFENFQRINLIRFFKYTPLTKNVFKKNTDS